jgi:cytochrome c5
MKKLTILVAIALLVACSPKVTKPAQTSEAEKPKVQFTDEQMAELNKGKLIYDQYCGLCHPSKKVTSRSAEAWTSVVPRMVVKVNKKTGTESIGQIDEQVMLKYLTTMCTQ